ncbi:MAG: hypothetical protein LH606_15795 [Cytophagaceae bacterium]|nr:hypothetical protein [Cytophagaceae bacterium]
MIINYLDTLPPLLLLVFATKRRIWATREQFIGYYLLVQVVLNGVANFLNELDWHNLYIYHLNILFSFALITLYFWHLFSNQLLRQFLVVGSIGFAAFYVFNITFLEKPDSAFSSNSLGLGSLFIVLYCLLYFTRLLLKPATENMFRTRTFWIAQALFMYYVSNFFLFISYRRLTELRPQDIRFVWQIHNFIFLMMCAYLLIGFLCKSSPLKSES